MDEDKVIISVDRKTLDFGILDYVQVSLSGRTTLCHH
jgi:hypothetical protein